MESHQKVESAPDGEPGMHVKEKVTVSNTDTKTARKQSSAERGTEPKPSEWL